MINIKNVADYCNKTECNDCFFSVDISEPEEPKLGCLFENIPFKYNASAIQQAYDKMITEIQNETKSI